MCLETYLQYEFANRAFLGSWGRLKYATFERIFLYFHVQIFKYCIAITSEQKSCIMSLLQQFFRFFFGHENIKICSLWNFKFHCKY